MFYPISILSLLLLLLIHLTNGHSQSEDPIPYSTRAHWMRRANAAIEEIEGTPCLFNAFATAIVNHTDTSDGPLGKLVCLGVNHIMRSGNPTVHGEVAAINNCSKILTDPKGEYKLDGAAALNAFQDLTLYTNGEPCPMCATAIRWANFAELVYGTNGKTLLERGWLQIDISAEKLFKHSARLPSTTRLVKDVLANETDPLFSWQFDRSEKCPKGCGRSADGSSCETTITRSQKEL